MKKATIHSYVTLKGISLGIFVRSVFNAPEAIKFTRAVSCELTGFEFVNKWQNWFFFEVWQNKSRCANYVFSSRCFSRSRLSTGLLLYCHTTCRSSNGYISIKIICMKGSSYFAFSGFTDHLLTNHAHKNLAHHVANG